MARSKFRSGIIHRNETVKNKIAETPVLINVNPKATTYKTIDSTALLIDFLKARVMASG